MNRWTGLFVNLNGQMKRIGNVNPATKEVTMYPEKQQYESEVLYYVNNHRLYK